MKQMIRMKLDILLTSVSDLVKTNTAQFHLAYLHLSSSQRQCWMLGWNGAEENAYIQQIYRKFIFTFYIKMWFIVRELHRL